MLKVTALCLSDGQVFEEVAFEGTKEQLREAMEDEIMVAFAYQYGNGQMKELNVNTVSVVSYQTDAGQGSCCPKKPQGSPKPDYGAKLIMFPQDRITNPPPVVSAQAQEIANAIFEAINESATQDALIDFFTGLTPKN